MKTTQEILSEITTITREIEEHYPELQKYLGETRTTLPQGDNSSAKLDLEALENYRDELKNLVEKYKKEH